MKSYIVVRAGGNESLGAPLEAAANGVADWLVTFNLRHLAEAAREFGIRALRPCDAWREIPRHANK
jgi:hypothetical protein